MNKTFYVIAGGPSFKDVTEEEWEFLKDKHTMMFSRIPYGNQKPEFYCSIEKEYIDKSILSYMARIGWFDVKLLLANPESLNLAKELGFHQVHKVFKWHAYFYPSRRPWFVDEPTPPNSFDECLARTFYQPLFRYRGQLTAILNACVILGATEIRLIGVDLNNQANFYEDFEYLKQTCKDDMAISEFIEYMKSKYAINRLDEKKQFNPDYNPDVMHTTNMPYYEKEKWGDRPLRGVSDVIEWMDKSMKSKGLKGIFTTSKKSLLYTSGKLEYKGITDESE